jgi:hypothetical protein
LTKGFHSPNNNKKRLVAIKASAIMLLVMSFGIIGTTSLTTTTVFAQGQSGRQNIPAGCPENTIHFEKGICYVEWTPHCEEPLVVVGAACVDPATNRPVKDPIWTCEYIEDEFGNCVTTPGGSEIGESGGNAQLVCPSGYELDQGICQADPIYGCGTAQKYLEEEKCIVGLIGGSHIPYSEEDPCGTAGLVLPEGSEYIYPHPYEPGTNVCVIVAPMGEYCPGEDYHFVNGVPKSSTINPETGKCEVKPGRGDENRRL